MMPAVHSTPIEKFTLSFDSTLIASSLGLVPLPLLAVHWRVTGRRSTLMSRTLGIQSPVTSHRPGLVPAVGDLHPLGMDLLLVEEIGGLRLRLLAGVTFQRYEDE